MAVNCKECKTELHPPDDAKNASGFCDDCFEKINREEVPDDEIIIEEEEAPQEPRVILTQQLLDPEVEKAFGEEVSDIYQYYSDVRERYPPIGLVGFAFFFKFVKEHQVEKPGIRSDKELIAHKPSLKERRGSKPQMRKRITENKE